ncbi:MAG: cysteine-rich CWC family protein [Burkholderiales bacterium]|nr:cysteine-rich CWC family protein [Burkholderiales bacterium]MCZ2134544.1 cysteine-rich CWC family protein [Burkholderiales bacterium]
MAVGTEGGERVAESDGDALPRAECCARCGARFSCAARGSACWCSLWPVLDVAARDPRLPDDRCLCPLCLNRALDAQANAQAIAASGAPAAG